MARYWTNLFSQRCIKYLLNIPAKIREKGRIDNMFLYRDRCNSESTCSKKIRTYFQFCISRVLDLTRKTRHRTLVDGNAFVFGRLATWAFVLQSFQTRDLAGIAFARPMSGECATMSPGEGELVEPRHTHVGGALRCQESLMGAPS